MIMVQRNFHIVRLLFFLLLLWGPLSSIQAKDFVVVIDAGHGGHDSGAVGQVSQEKDITLKVALAVGNLIESNCRDAKVIYTRKTDVFIPLDRRGAIANDAKANLFISIHANSVPKGAASPSGFEIYSLGLARSQANLEVAKRENSVILLEKDYKKRYAGFDPNSSESNIIFEFMQDKYMKESIHFASLVQSQFRNSQRIDRGVHQANLCVLRTSAMPSVLVELGFISNPDEENYMNTASGVSTLSQSIYRAFLSYKRENENRLRGADSVVSSDSTDEVKSTALKGTKRSKAEKKNVDADALADTVVVNNTANADTTATTATSDSLIFKLQILATRTKLEVGDSQLKGLSDVEYLEEDGYFKYFCASSSDYNSVYRKKREIESSFQGAFIVAYKNGVKMDTVQAIREFKKQRKLNNR